MAKKEPNSTVAETLTPEERDGIAKAISNWILENENEFNHIDSVYKGLVENEHIRCGSIDCILQKSRNAQLFYIRKYNNGKIDIDYNLRDNILGCTLEGVLMDLKCKKKRETLDNAITNYCNNIKIEVSNDDKEKIANSLKTAKDERNITGSHIDEKTGLPATDDQCREAWKYHIVGLLIIAFVEYLKEKKGSNGNKGDENIIRQCLSSWYDNKKSFNGVILNFTNEFINNKRDDLIKEILPIFKEQNNDIKEQLLNIISSLGEKQEFVSLESKRLRFSAL